LLGAALQGLRLHDNPALLAAAEGADHLCPVFILDPWFINPDR
jgi:cryptochrome